MKGITMTKTNKSTSSSSPSVKQATVAAIKSLSTVADKAFELYKQQKQDEWIKEQKAAGHHVMINDEGYLMSIDIVATYKI